MDAELRFHVEEYAADLVRSGVPREEALRRARIEFGGIESAKEECREARGISFVDSLVQDLRFGTRMLRKNPGFTAVAVLTLALGIGANTAVFTVVNGALLRSMPFPEADRLFLVSLNTGFQQFEWQPEVSDRDYLAFRRQEQSFEQVASFSQGSTANLTGAGDPVHIQVAYVTTEFFQTLRTNPAIGRGFAAGEDEPGLDNVVVLSNELWKERFGAGPEILGKTIRLDGISRTVIGIMPPGCEFPGVKVWMPLAIRVDEHNSFMRPVVGRVRSSVTPQQALAELKTVAKHLGPERDRMPLILPLRDLLVANIRPSLLVFAGAVAFVLLIACANVANLFLARATGRFQEMAVRSALGAGRWRLMRQLLAESTLISLAGGAAGILLAFWSVRALMALAPAGKVPRMEPSISTNPGGSKVTSAVGTPRVDARDRRALAVEHRQPANVEHRLLLRRRDALALRDFDRRHRGDRILLQLAHLESFLRLRAVNPGFSPHSVMTMTVDLPDSEYRTANQMQAFHTRMLGELSRLPGVLAAGAVNWIPLGETLAEGTFQVEGSKRPPGFMVDKPCVSPGYFKAMGMPVLRGRDFTESDSATTPRVVIVSQTVARTLWPGQDPIGKRISMEDEPKPEDWLTVVGVVDDVKQQGLAKGSEPAIYQPYLQVSQPFFLNHMTFMVRTALGPESVASGMRAVLRNVDKNEPISIRSMDSLIATTTAEPQFQARLLATFAVVALALTIVGIYGVLAYSVAQRTREIGVRMALGAQSRDVMQMLLRKALVLMSMGIILGGAGAFALTRVLTKFLFEVKPTDVPTFAAVALTLVLSALAACYVPARRAMKVDPMVALRYE